MSMLHTVREQECLECGELFVTVLFVVCDACTNKAADEEYNKLLAIIEEANTKATKAFGEVLTVPADSFIVNTDRVIDA